MRFITYLIISGWNPVDDEYELWAHPTLGGSYTVWQVAEKLGVKLYHVWHPVTLACQFCGITQYRVFVKGESAQCTGMPDVQSFQDAQDHVILQDRLRKALGGEEGMLWENE